MSTLFQLGARVLVHSPHVGIPRSLYTPVTGSSKYVTAVRRQEDETTAVLTGGTRQSAVTFDVLISEIATRPVDGDLLKVLGSTYRIRSAVPDSLAIIWRLDVDPT